MFLLASFLSKEKKLALVGRKQIIKIFVMNRTAKDLQFMRRAYELALRGKGRASPNPIVGAIVVKNGQIIGEGWHQRCGGPHAEIFALAQAGAKAEGATLYVTLEPCFHFGRTPPCVDAVIKSGIGEVVIGMTDPNPLTNGKSIAKLRRAGVKVRAGFLQEELAEANVPFIKFIQTGMPFVVAKVAQTLDGKTATRTGQSKWITAESTREFSRALRNDFDAIVVGADTVIQDNPGLNPNGRDKQLRKVVLDSTLRVSARAKLFAVARKEDCIVATTAKAAASRVKNFEKRGITVLVCPAKNGRVNLKWLFKELAQKGMINILVEGGAAVIGSALKEKLVDKMHIYVAPKILGDQDAQSCVKGLAISRVERAIRLSNVRTTPIGEDVFLEGHVRYR